MAPGAVLCAVSMHHGDRGVLSAPDQSNGGAAGGGDAYRMRGLCSCTPVFIKNPLLPQPDVAGKIRNYTEI